MECRQRTVPDFWRKRRAPFCCVGEGWETENARSEEDGLLAPMVDNGAGNTSSRTPRCCAGDRSPVGCEDSIMSSSSSVPIQGAGRFASHGC